MGNREVVQSIYDAADTGDVGAIEKVLHDEVVLLEPAHHPAVLTDAEHRDPPGVWRGRDQVIVGVTKVFTALRLTGVDLHALVADGDRVVGILTVHGHDHRGEPYTMPLAETFKLADGKVIEIAAYYFDVTQLCTHAGV